MPNSGGLLLVWGDGLVHKPSGCLTVYQTQFLSDPGYLLPGALVAMLRDGMVAKLERHCASEGVLSWEGSLFSG